MFKYTRLYVFLIITFVPSFASAVSVEIEKKAKFDVKLAITETELRMGLLEAKELKKNQGMLFLHKKPEKLPYWTKFTPINADFIFINGDEVCDIYENVPARDSTIFKSRCLANKVLQIVAGVVESRDIAIGDKVTITP